MFKSLDVTVKLIFATILVAFVALFVWHGYSTEKKVTTLTVNNAQQARTIKNQEGEIKTQGVVAAISEDTHKETAAEVKKVVQKQDTVVKKLEQKTDDINHTFALKPQTVANEVTKQEQLSSAQIDSLWELYCTDNSTATECKNPTSTEQGTNHA